MDCCLTLPLRIKSDKNVTKRNYGEIGADIYIYSLYKTYGPTIYA